nr:MAG TPA: hypothetical protein [Caudoviricetes sp.]
MTFDELRLPALFQLLPTVHRLHPATLALSEPDARF